MSKLSQVGRSGDLRIADLCCLPTSLWHDIINKIALDKFCFRFFMNFSFKWYTLVKILREQLKHVDGLVDKQDIPIYYIHVGYSRNSASK